MKLSITPLPKDEVGLYLVDKKDDVYISCSKAAGIVVGYNVNQALEDNASRLALTFGEDDSIKLSVVDPETKEITNYNVPKNFVYLEIINLLESLKNSLAH